MLHKAATIIAGVNLILLERVSVIRGIKKFQAVLLSKSKDLLNVATIPKTSRESSCNELYS